MSEDEEDFIKLTNDLIEAKILHVLSIYPMISPSMLQVGIGPGIPSKLWHQVLGRLVREGKVKERTIQLESPSERTQSYKIIQLMSTEDNRFAKLSNAD